jgi:uncharacterized membrane protein YraQ (UPF0718 family)
MPDMRTYLLTAPRWAVGLYSGLFFGIGIAVVTRSFDQPTSWLVAAVTGVVTGVLIGAVMAFTIGVQRRDLRAAAGDLPAAQLLDAYRAAVRGPIPADPQVRAAAARVAQRLIHAVRQTWILSSALAILLVVGAVMNTTTGEYGLAAMLAAAALANATEVYQLKRLRRRVERLSP